MDINKENPFAYAWLNSSYHETLFSSTPWQNINDILSVDLAKEVRKQFNNPYRKQMIIELLGDQFKRSYLSDEIDNPHILCPLNMSEEQRKKLENEAKSWLQLQMNEIALRKACAIKADENEEQLCVEMKDYLEHTYNIISTSLDRHLYSKQNLINAEINSNLKDVKNSKEIDLLKKISNFSDKNDLRGALKNKNILKSDEAKAINVINLSSEYSELIGASLLAILKKSPRRTAFVLQKLSGQQLTKNLREFIWSDILMRHERKKIETTAEVDIDLLLRKKFAGGVTRGKNELKLKDPCQTQIAGLIENAVIETYSRVKSMNVFLDELHLRQAMKILNILYTYSRDYEPYFIYWLLPFQLGFQVNKENKEIIYDLAMYLDLFVNNFFPRWNEIFTVAGKIMTDLSANDAEYYNHLKRISKINSKLSTKDFVNEIINTEGSKVSEFGEDAKANRELLFDPTIFIRKWIGECFGGILSQNSLLYVWDQLFMSLWSSYDLELITKAILYLLKSEFMMANDYDEMRMVFLNGPSNLHTSDIQSAFMHLSSGRKEGEVVYLNKSGTNSFSKDTGYYTKASSNNDNVRFDKISKLEPFGLENFKFSIVVPEVGPTSDFDPSKVVIEIRIYSGKQKISQDETNTVPVVMNKKPSLNNTKFYEAKIPKDKLIFDLEGYDQEKYGTNDIVATVALKYHTKSFSYFYLGYCKIIICTAQEIGAICTWETSPNQIEKLLHPGVVPEKVEKISDVPSLSSYKDRLGPGSKISLSVVGVTHEAYLDFS